ncbi:GNAT family N-acetyltransferase [Spirochaetota bacterium]
MNFIIEKARPDDRQAILQVMEQWNMHHIPSAEMEELDIACFFVARSSSGQVIGAAGYKILSKSRGKTTLLGVYPEISGLGVGKALQLARFEAMHKAGVKKVITNADRPEIIVWYKKHFGYYEIGTEKKQCSFGLESVGHWTTLETDLDKFFVNRKDNETRIQQYIKLNDPVPLVPFAPLIINVCLTGMVPTKLGNPHVPISVEEIISDAIKVHDAGAQVVHLHARDKSGHPVSDAAYYEQIICSLRKERPELICCVTASGRNEADFEKRAEVLYLSGAAKPDMASLTLGSINFLNGPSVNSINTIERLAMIMKERGIKPELEVFDAGMVNLAKYLERHRIISGIKYFNILLGNLNTAPATLASLSSIAGSLPKDSLWAAGGLGQFQLPMNAAAIAGGGHVRVGIEDSIYFDYNKEVVASNVMLVQRIVRLAEELQRPLATSEEARTMIGLVST